MSRYLFAIVLAMAVLFGWQIIFPPEQREIVNNEINDCKPYYQKVKELNCLLE